MDSTSESLLRRLQDPLDEGAWNRCCAIYTPLIVRWADSLGLPTSDADDVVQEVLVKLFRKMQQGFEYDPSQSFRAWLATVSRNTAINYLRDSDKHRSSVLVDLVDRSADSNDDIFCKEVFSSLVLDELLEQIRDEFESSSIEAFIKHNREGLSAQQAGELTGISAKAVRQASYRIRMRLRLLSDGMLD